MEKWATCCSKCSARDKATIDSTICPAPGRNHAVVTPVTLSSISCPSLVTMPRKLQMVYVGLNAIRVTIGSPLLIKPFPSPPPLGSTMVRPSASSLNGSLYSMSVRYLPSFVLWRFQPIWKPGVTYMPLSVLPRACPREVPRVLFPRFY